MENSEHIKILVQDPADGLIYKWDLDEFLKWYKQMQPKDQEPIFRLLQQEENEDWITLHYVADITTKDKDEGEEESSVIVP